MPNVASPVLLTLTRNKPFFTCEQRCYPPLDLSTCTTSSLRSQFTFICGKSVYPPQLAHSPRSSCQYSALTVMLLTNTSEERKKEKKIHTLGLLRGFSQWNVLLSDKFLRRRNFLWSRVCGSWGALPATGCLTAFGSSSPNPLYREVFLSFPSKWTFSTRIFYFVTVTDSSSTFIFAADSTSHASPGLSFLSPNQ